jgi:hypothetical protein
MLAQLMVRIFLRLTHAYPDIIALEELSKGIQEMVALETYARQVTIAQLIALILLHAPLESTHRLREERMLISVWIVLMEQSV